MRRAVIITGVNGGIGKALKSKFSSQGYAVIGIDKNTDQNSCDAYIQTDFSRLAVNEELQADFSRELMAAIRCYELKGLCNNSAVQILGGLEDLSVKDFQETLNVNLTVPFFLAKICVDSLSSFGGSILNIGSIHAKLTKPKFLAYATSKGALETLTRAMAVDVGSRVKVNLIAPAAIETGMLKAGFYGKEEKYKQLLSFHPRGVIGTVEEVALLAYRLVDDDISFLSGAIIDLSGGISSRLHDPS